MFLTNAHGIFIDRTDNLPQVTDFSHGSSVGDFNGDGSIDIFNNTLGDDEPTGSQLWINDGTGNFSVGADIADGMPDKYFDATFNGIDRTIGGPYYTAALDIGGDGNVDIYYGQVPNLTDPTAPEQYGYMENTGGGKFTLKIDPELAPPAPSMNGINALEGALVADFDNDGNDDLLVYERGDTSDSGRTWFQLLLNDGTDGLKDATDQLGGQLPGGGYEVALGGFPVIADLDADGDADILFRSLTLDGYGIVTVLLLNDGAGHFQRVESDALPPLIRNIKPVDMNGDWIPDLVYTLLDYDLPAKFQGSDGPTGSQYIGIVLGHINEPVNRAGWLTDDRIGRGKQGRCPARRRR